MDSAYPLTIYYDHSCSLCRQEMLKLKQHDHANKLYLIDCSDKNFVAPENAPSVQAMLQLIHAQTPDGNWLVGVPVFRLVYAAVGFHQVADFLGKPLIKRIMNKLYPHTARHRYLIPAWTVNLLLNQLAKKSSQKARACKDGQCSL